MSNYLSDQDYDFIYSKVPRLCVDLLIKNSNGQILLTKRDIEPYINHWHLPGGRVKFRETILDAFDRICFAELGENLVSREVANAPGLGFAHLCLPKLIGSCEYLEEEQGGSPRHSISLVYLLEIGGEVELKDGTFFSELPEVIIPMIGEFITKHKII